MIGNRKQQAAANEIRVSFTRRRAERSLPVPDRIQYLPQGPAESAAAAARPADPAAAALVVAAAAVEIAVDEAVPLTGQPAEPQRPSARTGPSCSRGTRCCRSRRTQSLPAARRPGSGSRPS